MTGGFGGGAADCGLDAVGDGGRVRLADCGLEAGLETGLEPTLGAQKGTNAIEPRSLPALNCSYGFSSASILYAGWRRAGGFSLHRGIALKEAPEPAADERTFARRLPSAARASSASGSSTRRNIPSKRHATRVGESVCHFSSLHLPSLLLPNPSPTSRSQESAPDLTMTPPKVLMVRMIQARMRGVECARGARDDDASGGA